MLTGQKYVQNVRALRMLVEELIHPVLIKYEDQLPGMNINAQSSGLNA